MFAGVVVNQKSIALNRIFHYLIPDDLDIQLGMIVEVSFGRQTLEAVVVELVAQIDYPETKLKSINRIVNPVPLFGQDLLALAKYMADYYLVSWTAALQCMLPSGMHLTGKMPKANIRRIARLSNLNLPQPRGLKQKAVLEYLSANNSSEELNKLLEATGASYQTVKNLLNQNYLDLVDEMVWGNNTIAKMLSAPSLTTEQQQAIEQIRANFQGVNKPVLLHGVTGSGKTEVYLALVEDTISRGKQAIILVPEIALTPQTVNVFQSRLGCKVAVLHSGLTDSERRSTWLGIAQNKYNVVIGARSGIFAPTPNLGLIIMDEEHETSYKQDTVPRFHTRNLALKRCALTGASMIMGSATPDLESYYKGKKTEEYFLVEMASRVNNRKMADIYLVDMREELKLGNNTIFSHLLQEKLKANLVAGKQSMLFLNRRGFDSFVSCRHCGYVVECPHCSVAMSYHLGSENLRCHYCGSTLRPPEICPACGSTAIRYFGAGTQKVAAAVEKLLPNARIARIDRDSTKERGSYERVYRQMLAGEIDILVGTQMIAKGLDFPNLTLVGVVAADTSLNLPDFRSGERTFQLITQVAGRAGRHLAGEVVVQTYSPEHNILYNIKHQDYKSFYEREIRQREILAYPPFTSIIRLVISSSDLMLAHNAGRKLAFYFQEQINESSSWSFWGPKPCPKEKIKDRHRLHIVLKGDNLTELRSLTQVAFEKYMANSKGTGDVQIAIDVEPLNMI